MTTVTITDQVVTATVTDNAINATIADQVVTATVSGGLLAGSESVAGALQLATAAEAAALTEAAKVLTPATFDDALGGVDGKLIRVDINGLVGDGVTHDTAALQTILTANESTADIILRFTPNKTYLLDKVTWSGSGSLIVDAQGANFKLVDSAAEEHIFDVINPTRFHIVGGTFDGNEANQTGTAEALIEVTTGANTESVIIQGVRFKDVKSKAIRVINASSGAVGSRFVSISDIELDTVTGNVGDPACIIVRGNQENTVIDNIRAFDCALVDAGKVIGFSADVSTTSDKVGNITISNVVTQNCGTTIFGQSYRNATITNISSRDIGTSSGGTDYNVNFIKIDDAGADARTTITNCVGTHTNGTYSPAIRLEDSGGTGDLITQNVSLTNCYSTGDIVCGGQGGHRLLRCETSEDIASSGGDNIFQLCTAGVTFTLQGELDQAIACKSPLVTLSADFQQVIGGNFAAVTMSNGADYSIVTGAYIKAATTAPVNIQGDNQIFRGNTVHNTGGLSIDVDKVGCTGVYVEDNYIYQTSTTSTLPQIRLVDPLEIFVRNNVSMGGGSRRIRRNAITQSIRGEISGNMNFVDGLVNLPGGTVGDLVLERNRYWSSGTLTELGSYHPNNYTITNDATDRTFDANSTTLAELADVVATLIKDMDRA